MDPEETQQNTKDFLSIGFFLETIVMSTVNMEEMPDGIELRELGEAMREQYCILIGTDTDKDYSLLEEAKIAQDAPEDLRGELASNARGIADMLISLGLAKKVCRWCYYNWMEVVKCRCF